MHFYDRSFISLRIFRLSSTPQGLCYWRCIMTIHTFTQVGMQNDKKKTISLFYLLQGNFDSSGMRIYYSLEPTQIKAGSLSIGSTSAPTFIIPPNAETFTYEAFCSSTCLDRVKNLDYCCFYYYYYYYYRACRKTAFRFLPHFYTHILLVCAIHCS